MATKQLLDNLNEIKNQKDTYLLPKNIKKNVSILGVTGTLEELDTSDATAKSDDIISPKTAYTKDGKVTGSITPDYSAEGEVSLAELNISSDLIMERQITDISTTCNICIKYNSSNLYVYRIVDGVVDYENPTTYSNADLSITSTVGFGRAKLAPQINSDGTINLVIVVAQSGVASAPFYIHLYKLNPETLSVEHCAVNNTAMKAGNQYHWITTTTKDIDIAFSSSNKFLVGTVHSSDAGSWGMATGYFTFAHMQILDSSSLSLLKSSTYSTGNAGFTQGWDGSFPRFHMFYQDGYFQIYEEKNYRVTSRDGVNTLTYWSMFLKESDYSFFYKTTTESTRNIFVECNGYIIGNRQVFSVNDINTAIGTTDFSPKFANFVGVMGKNILEINNGSCKVYAVNDDGSVILRNSFPATYGQYDNDNTNFVLQSDTSITLLNIQKIIIALNRLGIKYLTTLEGTVKESEMLIGKKAYSNNALLTGTMPNNGTLEYTPTTENQAIPLGYTDGGTVTGDANLLPENIKENVKLFGIRGTATVLNTYDATATAADILAPKVAYANGQQVVGSIETVYEGTGFVESDSYTKSTDWHDISKKAKLALYLNGSGLKIGYMNDGAIVDLKTFSSAELGTGTINTGRAIFFNELQSDKSIRILIVSSTSSSGTVNLYGGIYELDFSDIDNLKLTLVSTRTQILYYTGDNNLCRQFGEKLVWLDNNTCMLGTTLCPGGGYSYTTMYFKHILIHINGVEITTSNSKTTALTSNVYADAWGTRLSGLDNMFVSDKYVVSCISKAYRGGNVNNYYYVTVFTDLETYSDYFKLETTDTGYVSKGDLVYGNNGVYNVKSLDTKLASINLSLLATQGKARVGEDYFIISGGNLGIYKFNEYEVMLQNTYSNYKHAQLSSDTVWAISTGTNILTFAVEQSVVSMIRGGIIYTSTNDATSTESDIVSGKTAYVNGEKITGTIREVISGELTGADTSYFDSVFDVSDSNVIGIISNNPVDTFVRTGAKWRNLMSYENLAEAIGLTADKIKAGETILGITGTYVGDGAISQEEYNTALDTASDILGEEVNINE